MSRRMYGRQTTAVTSRKWKATKFEAEQMNVSCAHFGCTGFVGRYVAGVAAHHQFTNIMPYRFRAGTGGCIRLTKHIEDGTHGQNFATDFELDKEFVVKSILEKVDHVFNSIGLFLEPGFTQFGSSWFDMQGVNVEWPRMLARWSREMGIDRFVHVSCVGADPNSPSKYLRTKGEAEIAVLEEFPRATIMRATEMFGANDFNIQRILRGQFLLKIVPVANGGMRMVQPLFVGDFAEACVRAVGLNHTEGRIAELGGPVRCTWTDVCRFCAELNSLYHLVQPLPYWAYRILCAYNRHFPGRGVLVGCRVGAGTVCTEWLDRQYVDDVATPERDPDLLDWEDFGIPREDLHRIEDKYFLVANSYAQPGSGNYQDVGMLL